MAARDAANDVSNKLVQLTVNKNGYCSGSPDLSAQASRMAEDGAREGQLTHDAAARSRIFKESVAI
jgi:hypothetical protein